MTAPPTDLELAERQQALSTELGGAVTLDGLTRDYRIYQRRRGHRHSTDDLLTAWYAVTHAPNLPISTLLDLGTGIGSVGLSVLWRFPEATLTAIEVQDVSYRLFLSNLWANGVEDRVRPIHGDLRSSVPEGRTWPLVTGSPPYFDVKNGKVSADSQRAGARFELKGDVTDYCRAARRALASQGRFVFCFPTVQRARAERAIDGAELDLVAARDVVPRVGIPALFSLFACRLRGEGDAPPSLEAPFVVRDSEGNHTAEMTAVRALFGMTSQPQEGRPE